VHSSNWGKIKVLGKMNIFCKGKQPLNASKLHQKITDVVLQFFEEAKKN